MVNVSPDFVNVPIYLLHLLGMVLIYRLLKNVVGLLNVGYRSLQVTRFIEGDEILRLQRLIEGTRNGPHTMTVAFRLLAVLQEYLVVVFVELLRGLQVVG